jgi:outer membrane protein assembly factor BamB
MNRRKIAAVCFGIFSSLVAFSNISAQCLTGAHFAVCPGTDTIYVNNDKVLGALTLSTGALKWQGGLPKVDSGFLDPVVAARTAAIWEGFPDTRIYAFDASTGKPSWNLATSADDMTALGHCIFFNDAAHREGLVALDERSGKTVWGHRGTRLSKVDRVRFYALDGHTLLTNLFAIDGDSGRILARWPKSWAVSSAAFGDKFAAIGTEYSGPNSTKLAVYSVPGYQRLWTTSYPKRWDIEGVACDAEHILVASSPQESVLFHPGELRLELVEASSGKTVWSKTFEAVVLLPSPVALSQGVAIVVTGDSEDSSLVQGFDVLSGQSKWTVRTDHKLAGQIICAASKCYVGGNVEIAEVLAVDVQTGDQSWLRIPTQ